MTAPTGVRVVRWDRELFCARRDEVLEVYAEAMDVPPVAARARRGVLAGHLDRTGLSVVAAVDDDDRLVGVAYGYVGRRGQWWHDHVRAALADTLGPAAAASWLDGAFEVCELHVRPEAQAEGLGRRLLDTLLADVPARTAVLTTPDAQTRARGFYRAAGWQDLARRLVFPGDPREFAVLGLRLPPRSA
ncbi:MAG TPA: GNAT family N-acetyltransferase [Mycobacteriales bacterium]|nr:GNAT family N-acetyltransferase [Mycobacteriales bacterium]